MSKDFGPWKISYFFCSTEIATNASELSKIHLPLCQQFYLMRARKANEFTPWEQSQQYEMDRIPMATHRDQEQRSLVSVSTINYTQPLLQEVVRHRREPSVRKMIPKEKVEEPREKIRLKRIELSSLMGIGKGLVGEISVLKKDIQGRMMQYLLLVYLAQELKQEITAQKGEKIKQKLECLFPLIGITNTSRDQYKARSNLNDLVHFKNN